MNSDPGFYTEGQFALIRRRFFQQASGVVALVLLVLFLLIGLFAPFLSPHDPSIRGANPDYKRGAPQGLHFRDENGFSWRPFTYTYTRSGGSIDLRALAGAGGSNLDALDALTRSGALNSSEQGRYTVDTGQRRYIEWFVRSWEYDIVDLSLPAHWFGAAEPWRLRVSSDLHLFGVEGGIHLFGTDEDGKDVFSRTLHAIWVTVSIAFLAIAIKLVVSLLVGGVSGYFGGRVDAVLMSITEAIRVVPQIPLYLAFAVAIAQLDLTSVQRYFLIALVLGALDFGALGRRLRTHVLAERNQDYVLAARLSGASDARIIGRHLIPSFASYIIIDTLINLPYMILAETSLSFLGLGLTDPVNSLGVLLQKAQDPEIQQSMPWQYLPVAVFVGLILTFVVAGDALRDAADPYRERRR